MKPNFTIEFKSRWDQGLICVDPGTRFLGWAVFGLTDLSATLIKSGYITTNLFDNNNDWISRIDYMTSQMQQIFEHIVGSKITILIEQPMNFMSSKGSAATNSGAVNKLMACVFQLKGMINALYPNNIVKLIPVQTWKGNVPKEITQKRVKKYWNWEGEVDEIDACGIGDWYIRKILHYKPVK
jgi:Holliday junction resolvasome RuvABC endonuclease subunit